jgi:hypothetical protein
MTSFGDQKYICIRLYLVRHKKNYSANNEIKVVLQNQPDFLMLTDQEETILILNSYWNIGNSQI